MLLLSILAALIGQASENASTWLSRAAAEFNRHEFSQAAVSFQHAIDLDPNRAEAYKGLGMAELELKNYDAAYRSWLKAADLNPNDGKTKYYLGRLFYEANFPNEAAAWLREALKVAPDDLPLQLIWGYVRKPSASMIPPVNFIGKLSPKAMRKANLSHGRISVLRTI
jgi:tetratricopeptide (TPR) repeat protein